eukprot:s1225_g8.t1
MAWMVLWMLLVSSESFQDVVGSCANETCDEENAMVQLLKAQSSSLPAWILGGTGQSCKDACEALEPVSGSCDLSTMQDINIPDLFLTFQNLNPGGSTLQNTDAFPSNAEKKAGIEYTQTNVALVGLQTTLHVAADRSSMTCDATPSSNNRRRMCYCTTAQNNDGLVDGDPHVHTLRGAHYTLLRHGLFRAWSFKKGQTDLELLAAYGKPRCAIALTSGAVSGSGAGDAIFGAAGAARGSAAFSGTCLATAWRRVRNLSRPESGSLKGL